MKQDFYKDRLSDRGIEVIIPDDVDVGVVNRIVFEELCVGKINEKSRKIFQKIIEKMQKKGAEGVILGCTEIGLLIHQQMFLSRYLIQQLFMQKRQFKLH